MSLPDLIVPHRSVHGQVDQAQFRPVMLEPVDAGLSAVGGAVVEDPEHSTRGGVGLGGHDPVDQPIEGVDAGGLLAAAEHRPNYVTVIMRSTTKYLGRVGALAVALGIGAGLAATPWVAYCLRLVPVVTQPLVIAVEDKQRVAVQQPIKMCLRGIRVVAYACATFGRPKQ